MGPCFHPATGDVLNPSTNPISPAGDAPQIPRSARLQWTVLAVAAAAILGRLPALGAWWTQDDWGLIGRAAGLLPSAGTELPARILSQHWWWSVVWPWFGLDATPHAVLRLLLHAGAAVLVVRIGRRVGLPPLGAACAGFYFAAQPLAFTPLYWASGVQELLAAFFALLAVERWLHGTRDSGRRNLLFSVLAAVLSMLSKESGLGLPILFLILLWSGVGVRLQDKAFAWALDLLLLLVAVVETVLVLAHFGTETGQPYATGGAEVVFANLGVFGYWLASFGPTFASRLGWGMASVGLVFFVLWAVLALFRWRSGSRVAAAALVAALLSLAPALPLAGQIHPYLAYLAAAAYALMLGSLFPRRWTLSWPVLALLLTLALAWGYGGMRARLGERDSRGLPADPIVRTTALSWETCRALPDLPLSLETGSKPAITFLQFPFDTRSAEMASRLGDDWVEGSDLYLAIGGEIGPRMVLGDSVSIRWTNSLFSNPRGALVLCESPGGFRHWGSTANACLYAALTDIALGHFERARKHLLRGGDLGGETFGFSWDEEQMIVPFQRSLDRKIAFVDWTVSRLDEGASSGQETGGLQDIYFNLLATCTGKSVDEITAGSQLIRVEQDRPDSAKSE